MRLQISRIFNEYPDEKGNRYPLFALSGEASSWLFAIKFWDKINDLYGTNFDQYEEDVAPKNVVIGIIEALYKLCKSLSSSEVKNFEFVYARSVAGESLVAKISREQLLSELTEFMRFLKKATESGLSLEFSL